MRCLELEVALARWLLAPVPPFVLVADDGEVRLRSHPAGLRLEIALDLPSPDDVLLDACLDLARASLAHFPAALARAAADGRLWLVSELAGDTAVEELLDLLEVGLNQRDAWQAALASYRRRIPPVRLLPTVLAQGSHHA